MSIIGEDVVRVFGEICMSRGECEGRFSGRMVKKSKNEGLAL